jgi:hypothetical protein
MKWGFWPIFFWMAWVFAFITWEAYAGYKGMGSGDIPMLTQATVRFIPWWVTMPFITWLWFHFLVRYMDPKYIEWLKTGVK